MADIIQGHPIPQDITGFQFRLIGDMTVKQFAYLGVGLVLGWVAFQLPVPFIFRVFIAAIPVITGLIFAFVPVQGISADTLIFLFFKALIRPNQYVYNKVGKDFTSKQSSTEQHSQSIQSTTTLIGTHQTKKDEKDTHTQDITPATAPVQELPVTHAPAAAVLFNQPAVSSAPIHASTTPTEPIKEDQHKQPEPTTQAVTNDSPPTPPPDLQKQLQEMLAQKQQLEQQLQQLQSAQQRPEPEPQPPPPPPAPTAPASPTFMKKVTDQTKKQATVPFMPDSPNLIAGVITDSRGNVLPNILIEVKDKDDNPVRAFKTNALGQFASATPLLNGTYTVTFEDSKKQQRFDVVELSVTGVNIPPLEITSIDEREELRKTLFEQA